MKKIVFTIFMLSFLAIFSNVSAQSNADSLIITPKRIYPVKQAGEVLTPVQLNQILSTNPNSRKEMEAAKGNQAFAMILGGAGGFMIGWPLGTAIGGGEPNWLLAGIGAGLVALSIPISSSAKKKTMKAIELYNGGLVPQKEEEGMSLRFNGSPNGVGLVLKF